MSNRTKQKTKTEPLFPYNREITTFRDVGDWELGNFSQKEPACFNGSVSIFRHRVTVERIKEPVQILAERLRKLWRECDNHHHWMPLEKMAKRLGITLNRDECGCDRKDK